MDSGELKMRNRNSIKIVKITDFGLDLYEFGEWFRKHNRRLYQRPNKKSENKKSGILYAGLYDTIHTIVNIFLTESRKPITTKEQTSEYFDPWVKSYLKRKTEDSRYL
eukprot:UN03381